MGEITDKHRSQSGSCMIGRKSIDAPFERAAWWQTRPFVACLVLLSVIPLLLPTVPPLVDVPGHIGRLHLMLGGSAFLSKFYSPGTWPIGNLGVDLLVMAIGRFTGAELATRIIVTLIPPATVLAMLWVAREAHGRLPPTAAFAVPLAYSHPFLYGFVNFSLAVVFALATFAMWLKLGRQTRFRTRAFVMVPLALATFVAHVSAWGLLGLLAFASESARERARGTTWLRTIKTSALRCLPLALPLIILLLWRAGAGAGGATSGWFDPLDKVGRLMTVLRDRWLAIDLISLSVVITLLFYAWRSREAHFSRLLAWPAGLVLVAFLALPSTLFGSSFADMRIAPAMLILGVLSVNVAPAVDRRHAGWLAMFAVGFAIIRLTSVSLSLHLAANRHHELLAALDHLPRQSRVAVLVDHRSDWWPLPRNDHIGSMAIVRRDSFSNDQWDLEGGTSVRVHYPAAGRFMSDDSQIVAPHSNASSLQRALADLPRSAFDALWIVDSAPRQHPVGWLPIYQAPGNALYVRSDQAGRRATQP